MHKELIIATRPYAVKADYETELQYSLTFSCDGEKSICLTDYETATLVAWLIDIGAVRLTVKGTVALNG